MAVFTTAGSLLVSGTTNARNFETPTPDAFDRTPYSYSEFRIEQYTPPYLHLPNRPVITRAPAWAAYSGTIPVG